jgi:AcrR family transcriptional regulator
MRRTPQEAALTRTAIVAAARDLFTARGYAATGTTDVVVQAGVTRGALYHHFADKTDLFRAVFLELVHELNEHVLAAAVGHRDAFEAFLAACRASMTFMGRPDYRQIALVDGPAVLGPIEWHALDASIGLESMEAGLKSLHHAGVLDQAPDHALAVVLFGALTEGGLAASRGDGDPDVLFAAFRKLIELLASTPEPSHPRHRTA